MSFFSSQCLSLPHNCVLNQAFLSVDNGPEITKAIKSVLKDDYNYDSTVSRLILLIHLPSMHPFSFNFPQPTVYALYRSFTECQFIEDEGDIVFYKNRQGKAARAVHPGVSEAVKGRIEIQDNVELDFELEGGATGVGDELDKNYNRRGGKHVFNFSLK